MHAHPVLEVDLADLAHTRAAAHALAPLLTAGDLLLFSGELGAGKTTFTRALGEGLGVREGVISPTFVLSRVHPNLSDGTRPGGPDLVHVDAYRLSSAEELDDLDLEFSLEKSVTVIEWGRGKAEHLRRRALMPQNRGCCALPLTAHDGKAKRIEVLKPPCSNSASSNLF